MSQELIDRLERRMRPNQFRTTRGRLPDIVDPLCAAAAQSLRTLQSQLAERERELAEALAVIRLYSTDEECGQCEAGLSSGHAARVFLASKEQNDG